MWRTLDDTCLACRAKQVSFGGDQVIWDWTRAWHMFSLSTGAQLSSRFLKFQRGALMACFSRKFDKETLRTKTHRSPVFYISKRGSDSRWVSTRWHSFFHNAEKIWLFFIHQFKQNMKYCCFSACTRSIFDQNNIFSPSTVHILNTLRIL